MCVFMCLCLGVWVADHGSNSEKIDILVLVKRCIPSRACERECELLIIALTDCKVCEFLSLQCFIVLLSILCAISVLLLSVTCAISVCGGSTEPS